LEWLKQEGIDLTNECILEEDELCSRSATGLLKLQQTIWRINRSISRCSSLTEALEVVNEMKAAGIDAANEGTYLALITVCRRQQQGDRALSIYEAMKEAGVQPGVLTYNTLISCCQQSKRLEDAFRIKKEMEAAGVNPDVVTYTALMALVVKTGPYRGRSNPTQRLEKALQLYQEMLDRSIQPDSITYNTLMFAGAQAKMPGKVLEVYRTMVAAGVPPDQFTFGFILESAGAGGRLKVALEIFEEMRAAGVAPKTNTYNFLIEACASAPTPDAEKAWALYEEMKTVEGVVPNAQTYNHLISASCKGGDNAGALKAYELMWNSGYQRAVTSATFNKLIQSASQTEGLESALQMYRKMLDLGYKPDSITYSTLVVACTREDDLNQALLVSQEMEKQGVKANQVVQHSIIGAFGQAGQWEDAVATFRALQEGEEQLTSVSYSIIFDACFGKGGAEELLKRTKSGKLEITPGIEAAISLYDEAVEVGFFTNFTQTDLARCDVRTMSTSGTVVTILAWLLRIGEEPPASDILIITGVSVKKNVAAGKPRKVRYTKNHTIALSTLKAVGLSCKPLDTATMQALTVSGAEIKNWLEDAQGESVVEEEKNQISK
jgi:pentatricopeptide repeat domain-containing protein 1